MTTRATTAEVREAMFDAARELIGTVGYSQMSHADITSAVGIGRTTFYEHFSSKEDLLVQLVRQDLPDTINELVGGIDDTLDPPARLRSLAEAMVQFVGTDHMGLILHTEVPLLSSEAQKQIADAHEGLTSEFAAVYRAGVASGDFAPYSPRFAGRMMEQIIMTGGKVVMADAEPARNVRRIARDTAAVLVNALSARD